MFNNFSAEVALYVFLALLGGFVFGFLYRLVLKKFAKKTPYGVQRNIDVSGRILRAVIGVALVVWAVMTDWSPTLFFFAGFTFFEAIFSWCGFYAAIGKNSCPIN